MCPIQYFPGTLICLTRYLWTDICTLLKKRKHRPDVWSSLQTSFWSLTVLSEPSKQFWKKKQMDLRKQKNRWTWENKIFTQTELTGESAKKMGKKKKQQKKTLIPGPPLWREDWAKVTLFEQMVIPMSLPSLMIFDHSTSYFSSLVLTCSRPLTCTVRADPKQQTSLNRTGLALLSQTRAMRQAIGLGSGSMTTTMTMHTKKTLCFLLRIYTR